MNPIEVACKRNDGKIEFTRTAKNRCSPQTFVALTKYLTQLDSLRTEISKSKNPDVFLSAYNNLPCQTCSNAGITCKAQQILLPNDKAIQKLRTFHNGLFDDVLRRLTESKLEILIAGSSGIASVMRKTALFPGFEPKDIDCYIRQISSAKIKRFDEALRQAFPNERIIIVRRPMTLTWWVFDRNDSHRITVQLNVLYVRSWADVFVMYHSDLVAVGYDVVASRFVTLTKRWQNFINSYPNALFTNINTRGPLGLLEGACRKYVGRGFKAQSVNVVFSGEASPMEPPVEMSGRGHGDHGTGTLYETLIDSYGKCSDIALSDTIDYLHTKGIVPRYLDLAELTEQDPFVKYVVDFEYPNGVECPITMERYNLAVANRRCRHEVSLKAYILMNTFTECPICRAKFDPWVYNCLSETRPLESDRQEKPVRVRFHRFPGVGTEDGPDAGLEDGPEDGPEIGLEAGPEAGPEAESQAEPEAVPEPEPESEPEARQGAWRYLRGPVGRPQLRSRLPRLVRARPARSEGPPDDGLGPDDL